MTLSRAEQAKTIEQRFWERVLKSRNGHWYWTIYANPDGYGRCSVRKRNGEFAHRVAWELTNEPIPDGMVIDHLCKVRLCVNPAHLEVVTKAENQRRSHLGAKREPREFCQRGHNDWMQTKTQRVCRVCKNAAARREYQRRKTSP